MTESASNILEDKSRDDRELGDKGPISFDDATLVSRCRKGDMAAFGSLVAKYQHRVFGLIYRMCPRRSDAEELAQETFLRALEKIGQFRGNSRFYTWLFRIAVNLVISHRRRGGRVKFHSLSGGAVDGGQAEALTAAMSARRSPGPQAAAMAVETKRRVIEALESLDDELRLTVILRDMEGMDYAQVGQVLEMPIGTVKSRLHRARNLLKDKLADLVC